MEDPHTPENSRPVSRAQSDVSFATEVPDSPQGPSRSLAREVAHIKSLISRSQGAPRHSESTISAQIFRNRQEPVSQARILHDLDSLKRRIRQEQQLVRRSSEADPDTESEADEVFDEREEELESIREELAHERQQREQWLESAEQKIDDLTTEKDDLSQRLEDSKDELSKTQSEKDNVHQSLKEAEGKIGELQEQVQDIRNSLESARREHDDLKSSYENGQSSLHTLRAEKEELNQKFDDVRQSLNDVQKQVEGLTSEKQKSSTNASDANDELAKLKKLKAEVDLSLAESSEKITGLEENNRVAGEHVQRLISEHNAREDESKRRFNDLQKRHDDFEKEAQTSDGKVKELEKGALDHDIRRRDLVEQVEEHKKLLAEARRDIHLHGKEIGKLLNEHQNTKAQIETVTKERDGIRAKHEEILSETDQQAQQAEDQSKQLKMDHEVVIKSLANRHNAERKRMQTELSEARDAHSKEIKGIRSDHSNEIQSTRDSAAESRRQADDADASSRAKLAEIESDMAASEQRATGAEALLKAKEAELGNEITGKENELADVHGQLSELQQRFFDQSSEHDRKNVELSQAAEDARRALKESGKTREADVLELKANHVSDLDELKVSHTVDVDRMRGEAADATGKLRQDNSKALDEVHARHRAAIEDAKRDAESRLTEVKDGHVKETERLIAEHRSTSEKDTAEREATVASLGADLEKAQEAHEAASISFAEEIARLKAEHVHRVKQLETGWSSKADEAARSHQADMQRAADEASQRAARARDDFQRQMDELTAAAEAQLTGAREDSASEFCKVEAELDAAKKVVEATKAELESARAQHESESNRVRESRDDELASVKAEHQASFDRLVADYEADNEASEQEHQKDLANLRSTLEDITAQIKTEHETRVRALTAEKEATTAEHSRGVNDLEDKARQTRSDHETEVERIRNDYERQLEDARSSLRAANVEVLERHKATLRDQQANSAGELKKARQLYEEASQAAKAESQFALDKRSEEHEVMVRQMHADFDQTHEDNKRTHEQRLAQAEASSDARVVDLQAEYSNALKNSETGNGAALEALRQCHEKASREIIQSHTDELDVVKETHEEYINNLESSLHTELEEARATHARALSDRDAEFASKVSGLKQEHERALSDAAKSSDDSTAKTLKTLSERHTQLLAQTEDRARLDSEQRTSEAERRHRDTLKKATNDAKQASQVEIADVKRSHEEALSDVREGAKRRADARIVKLEQEQEASLAAALANADDELEERLRAQRKAHSKEFDQLHENLNIDLTSLQIQLEEASELRTTQLQATETEHQSAVAELGEKIKTAEQTSSALQARLDAELISHAEAERSLAEMRKQRFGGDRGTDEAKDVLQQQVTSLQAEKEALLKSIEGTSRSTMFGGDEYMESVVTSGDALTVEAEREQAHNSVQRNAEEKSELARQNEFLEKQLETMMQLQSGPQTPAPTSRSDAIVQTDPVMVLDEGTDPRAIPEQKSDASMSKTAKLQRQAPRIIDISKGQQSQTNGTADRAWKTRSFEDYLHHAQAELSELGSVITANEALFAQKIQEHVGDLQRAKDQLAAEYTDKFDALLGEKERRERDVSAKSAAEFAKERKDLVKKFGAGDEEPAKQAALITNLSSPKKRALRSAEERLVSEYNRRIVKRKSQIAMEHAEEFQTLTQDYDRSLAELLGNREKLENDLSVEPSKFEQDLDEFDVKSGELERVKANSAQNSPQTKLPERDVFDDAQPDDSNQGEKSPIDNAPRSQLPKRTLTSTPRTPTSIPRAVPFPGNRDSPEATSQPRTPRMTGEGQRSASERYQPARQQSLMRPKGPPDGSLNKRVPTDPRRLDKRAALSTSSNFTQNLSIEPSDFEQTVPQQGNGSMSLETQRLQPSKQKSLRHSSGMMYSNWQQTLNNT